jgi:hypothetical protein
MGLRESFLLYHLLVSGKATELSRHEAGDYDARVSSSRPSPVAAAAAPLAAALAAPPSVLRAQDGPTAEAFFNTHLTLREGRTQIESVERINDPAVTSNGFNAPPEDWEGRIDWILVGGPVEVPSISTIVHSVGGRYPSDHYPVLATLRLGPS